ncbi:hypothetical protein Ae168Ps1_6039 [Pseudonocardia sp. Ae168_Ps1]|nr:hypothetical protein Ae168Ps1_6039 [Pseudonocardia sp. Ae168_Ps1]OLL89358.1 hypothetical protein Ae356Ps1_6102 [Pseudonocardia sp. Ae356_Ps1]
MVMFGSGSMDGGSGAGDEAPSLARRRACRWS